MSNYKFLTLTLGLSMLLSSCTSSSKSAGDPQSLSGSSLHAGDRPREDDPCSDPMTCGGGGSGNFDINDFESLAQKNKAKITWAECASSETSLHYEAGSPKSAVPITSISTSNRKITLGERLPGIKANMKLQNFANVMKSGVAYTNPLTVSSFTLGTTSTVITTKESTSGLSIVNPATAAVFLQYALTRPNCETSGINPLYIRGSRFPISEEDISLGVAGSNFGVSAQCMLFVLDSSKYTPIDSSTALWTIPAFSATPSTNTKIMNISSYKNPSSFQGKYRVTTDTGQVTEVISTVANIKVCTTAQAQKVLLSMGSGERNFSEPFYAFEYGVAEKTPIAPAIESICITKKKDFDKSNTMSNNCQNPRKDNDCHSDEIVTIKGKSFQHKNSSWICPSKSGDNPAIDYCDSARPDTRRKMIPLNVETTFGGERGQKECHALQDGKWGGTNNLDFLPGTTSANANSGGCSPEGVSGGTCTRIHCECPRCLDGDDDDSGHRLVNIVVEHSDHKKGEHGHPDDDDDDDDSGDKLRCHHDVTPTPTPGKTCMELETCDPAPVAPAPIAASVLADKSTIRVTFTEVNDDPPMTNATCMTAGIADPLKCPKTALPVDIYDLRSSNNSISEFNWALGSKYTGILQGQANNVGNLREVFFSNVAPNTTMCFGVKALDGARQTSPLAASSCVTTPALPVINTPPCPIHLTAVLNPADQYGSAILSWVEPSADSSTLGGICTSLGTTPVTGVVVKYRTDTFGIGDGVDIFADPYFNSDDQGSFTILPGGDVNAPGQTHSLMVSLSPNTTYYFAVNAFTAPAIPGSNPYPLDSLDNPLGNPENVSMLANVASVKTHSITLPHGDGTFVDLSSNLPRNIEIPSEFLAINVGNSVKIMPNINGAASGKGSWILVSDAEAGLKILKVADDDNVNTTLTNCEKPVEELGLWPNCAADLHPVVQISGTPVPGDGQADILLRDRNFNRYSFGTSTQDLNFPTDPTKLIWTPLDPTNSTDCDGKDFDTQDPNNPATVRNAILVDSYANCNLPKIGKYTGNKFVEIGKINNDPEPDLVLANSTGEIRDVIYINSGSDLCNLPAGGNPTWPGRTSDSPDGIPCFNAPIELDVQTNGGAKQPSTRTHLYVQDTTKDEAADLIVVIGNGQKTTFYKNDCRSNPTCTSSDFSRVSGILWSASTTLHPLGEDISSQGVICEDVAFLDLDGDNVRDMICTNTHTTTVVTIDPVTNLPVIDDQGVDWAFKGTPDVVNGFRFVRNNSLLPFELQNKNCDNSFLATKTVAGFDYLVAGHSTAGTSSTDGNAWICTTELFRRSGSGSFLKVQDLADNITSCHNGEIGDSGFRNALRTGPDADVILACGNGANMIANPAFSGTRLFLNNGTGSYPVMPSPISVFSQDCPVNASCTTSGSTPLVYNSDPLYIPGAVNAVGMGDLSQDGVPDLYFGNGTISTNNSIRNLFFKQNSSTTPGLQSGTIYSVPFPDDGGILLETVK